MTAGGRGYEEAVRGYLADCNLAAAELEAAGSSLDPKAHPTTDGAVKMIPHGGDPAEAAKIREAFRTARMSRPEVVAARSEPELEI